MGSAAEDANANGQAGKCACGESHDIAHLFNKNKEWAADMVRTDPEYFHRLAEQQAPDYFWIGCADSRVPANQIIGLYPGEVFVQRNVGNQANLRDFNCMSCLEYAVNHLKVKHIIVAGHDNCGAVKAALTVPCRNESLVNFWISEIRDVRNDNMEELSKIEAFDKRTRRLTELNVLRQVFNVCTSPIVQSAWNRQDHIAVHGICYDVGTGIMRQLAGPVTSLDELQSYVDNNRSLLGKLQVAMVYSQLP